MDGPHMTIAPTIVNDTPLKQDPPASAVKPTVQTSANLHLESAAPHQEHADHQEPVEAHEALEHHEHRPWNPLTLLCILAVIFMLNWSQDVIIPVMIGVLLSYALSPIVNFLEDLHIPRALGAAALLLSILGGIGTMGYRLSDDATSLIETLPEAAENFRRALRDTKGNSVGALENLQLAVEELQLAAEDGDSEQELPDGVTVVQIEEPRLNIQEYLRLGTMSALAVAGQAGVVLFLVFFLLTAGDTFRRKLIKIAGPTFAKKKITLQLLNEITDQIQRYLLVQMATSILVGVATWLVFLWIGLENAAIWGIAAAVFNTIPYLGPVVVTGGTAIVAFLQFESIGMAALVAGVSLLITSLEGFLLTPWLVGRASRMNPVAVFIAVLFWGWLWGVWGLLLGLPIIMTIKAICDRVEDLQPVGEMLGE
jgi:predicted PurR-regulated permease PerM